MRKNRMMLIVSLVIALVLNCNAFACTLLCDANVRDAYGNVVGTAGCGDYVEVQGYEECTGRIIIIDYSTGACGTVVEGALDGYYYEPESYYDDYDCYTEESDVYYDDSAYNTCDGYTEYNDCDCYYDEEYTGETYADCSDNYSYTEELVDYTDCSENYDYTTDTDCSVEYADSGIDYDIDYETDCEVNYEVNYNSDCEANYEESCTSYGYTWVDVDLSTQIISVYSDENQILASCCVTGMAGLMDTPCGVWSILNKERNATLIGDDYVCPVDFWMPFTESGCGIHDATWRSDFSSDAYTYAGSHGCVNVGYDTASQIYGMVDCGTSVVVHY